MNLQEAIKRVAKFASPPKQRGMTTCIRFIPPVKNVVSVSRVYATDGITGCVIELDPGIIVPDLVLSAKACADGFASLQEPTITDLNEPGWVWLHKAGTDPTLGYKVGRYEIGSFPSLPAQPDDFEWVGNLPAAGRVAHACGDSNDMPEMRYVHFRPGWVEATDSVRIAQAPITLFRDALVFSGVFENWPQEGGYVSVTSTQAHFKIGPEWRFTAVYKQHDIRPYPDIDLATASYDDDTAPFRVVLPVRQTLEAVRKAVKVSPNKLVRLRFSEGNMQVSGVVRDERAEDVIGHEIDVRALTEGRDEFVTTAYALVGFLQQTQTPNLLISTFQSPSTPLVARSGNLVEYIWPMMVGV